MRWPQAVQGDRHWRDCSLRGSALGGCGLAAPSACPHCWGHHTWEPGDTGQLHGHWAWCQQGAICIHHPAQIPCKGAARGPSLLRPPRRERSCVQKCCISSENPVLEVMAGLVQLGWLKP